jgi:hypothetical protein
MAEEESGIGAVIWGIFLMTSYAYIKYVGYTHGYVLLIVILNIILSVIGVFSLYGSYKLGEVLERNRYFYNETYEFIYSIIGSILIFIGTACFEFVILIILAGFFTNPLNPFNTPEIWINNIVNGFWFNLIGDLIYSVIAIGITSRFINYVPAYFGFVLGHILLTFIIGLLLGYGYSGLVLISGLIFGAIFGGIATLIIYLLDSFQ